MKACGFRRTSTTPERYVCLNTRQIEHSGTVAESICTTCPYARRLSFFEQTEMLAKRRLSRITTSCGNCSSDTARHLTYHIYPTKHSMSWRWNLQQLRQYWPVFNGKKVLAIAVDDGTATAATVQAFCCELGMQFDTVIVKSNNHRLREVRTWIPILNAIGVKDMGNNDVVFSAHAKGVRHHAASAVVKWWTACMYISLLGGINSVLQMLNTADAVGSFRRVGVFSGGTSAAQWHYSGTFFWWKPQAICNSGDGWRRIDKQFYGTETWIGKHLTYDRSACMFLDNAGDLYSLDYWLSYVIPEWNRLCGPWSIVEDACR